MNTTFPARPLAAITAITLLAAVGTFSAAAQQGTPAQGGTPSAAPRQQNQQPSQSNPTPAPQNPQPSGDKTRIPPSAAPDANLKPTAPGQVQPVQVQPGQVQPGQIPNQEVTANGLRYQRPFVLQNPQAEGRFTDSARRLVALEQRMARSNQDLLKRLGEVRTLTPERQSAALFDLVQQMLQDQAETHQYLVLSRSAWTGDLESAQTEAQATPTDGTVTSVLTPDPASKPATTPAPTSTSTQQPR